MKKVTLASILLGMTLGGLGIGAGIAAVVIGKIPTIRFNSTFHNSQPQAETTTASSGMCRLNSGVVFNKSLNGLVQAGSFAINPLPPLLNLPENTRILDAWAKLNPAPFPQISDRAKIASVPIIMYHDVVEKTKQVSWDVTVAELEEDFAQIKSQGLTPISMDQLVTHLRTGASLPPKPILLTFDDNYIGQYKYAFPLLKKYNFPALWSVHTRFVGVVDAKPKANWEQLKEMAASGLITIAAHTVNHHNLATLANAGEYSKIEQEIRESKTALEQQLGFPIRYFTYPEGGYTERVKTLVQQAGFEAALSMSLDPAEELPAQKSPDLLSLRRYGQSRFSEAVAIASNGQPTPEIKDDELPDSRTVNFTAPIQKQTLVHGNMPLTIISGGRPVTVHHHTRDQVEVLKKTAQAIAAVDGGFFSLEFLDSNQMIGPVMSQFSKQAGILDPGRRGENPLLNGRPLVLISPTDVKFVNYNAALHNTKEALQAELADVTDAFVGAGWLVRNGVPQNAASFGKLFGFDANRDRAFWGIDRKGRPVVGVTMEMIDSVGLGQLLAKSGMTTAVMLDSGASTSLAYRGKNLMAFNPRPVPHIVALLNPDRATAVKWGGAISCVTSIRN